MEEVDWHLERLAKKLRTFQVGEHTENWQEWQDHWKLQGENHKRLKELGVVGESLGRIYR